MLISSSGFVCICPPKSVELGQDSKLHRADHQAELHQEVEFPVAKASSNTYAYLPGGGVRAINPNSSMTLHETETCIAVFKGCVSALHAGFALAVFLRMQILFLGALVHIRFPCRNLTNKAQLALCLPTGTQHVSVRSREKPAALHHISSSWWASLHSRFVYSRSLLFAGS